MNIRSSAGLAFADEVCDVRTYGATGDGAAKDTAAIQKAIDGGGAIDGRGLAWWPDRSPANRHLQDLNTRGGK